MKTFMLTEELDGFLKSPSWRLKRIGKFFKNFFNLNQFLSSSGLTEKLGIESDGIW
jgi:hypothetical protein